MAIDYALINNEPPRVRQARLWLDQFVVNDPIKSLFNPEFSIARDFATNRARLALTITAPCAYTNGETARVVTMDDLPKSIDTLVSFADYARAMLRETILHEIDEAITVNGQRIYDPHPQKKGS